MLGAEKCLMAGFCVIQNKRVFDNELYERLLVGKWQKTGKL